MNESCWICLACVPACRLLKLGLPTRHAVLPQSRVTALLPHRRTLGTGFYSRNSTSKKTARDQAHQTFSVSSRGTQQQRSGLTLPFRHQLLPNHIPLHLIPSLPTPPPPLSCSSLCPCPRQLLSPPWPVYG